MKEGKLDLAGSSYSNSRVAPCCGTSPYAHATGVSLSCCFPNIRTGLLYCCVCMCLCVVVFFLARCLLVGLFAHFWRQSRASAPPGSKHLASTLMLLMLGYPWCIISGVLGDLIWLYLVQCWGFVGHCGFVASLLSPNWGSTWLRGVLNASVIADECWAYVGTCCD